MGFACVKFCKVRKNMEFVVLLVNDYVVNGAHTISDVDLSYNGYNNVVSMESFYKVEHPGDDYNAVSLATGRQYTVGKNIEVFICE